MVAIENGLTYAGSPWNIAYSYQRVRYRAPLLELATWPNDPNRLHRFRRS